MVVDSNGDVVPVGVEPSLEQSLSSDEQKVRDSATFLRRLFAVSEEGILPFIHTRWPIIPYLQRDLKWLLR